MAKIKFDHAVIYHGVYYPANTEIEEKKGKKQGNKEQVNTNDNGAGTDTKVGDSAD